MLISVSPEQKENALPPIQLTIYVIPSDPLTVDGILIDTILSSYTHARELFPT